MLDKQDVCPSSPLSFILLLHCAGEFVIVYHLQNPLRLSWGETQQEDETGRRYSLRQ